MRSTNAPGPFEGKAVFDVHGERVGTLTDLVVHGQSVSALRVRLDEGDREVELPRDWFQETTRDGIMLAKGAGEISGS